MSGVPIEGSTSAFRHHARTMLSAYALRVFLTSLVATGLAGGFAALLYGLITAQEQQVIPLVAFLQAGGLSASFLLSLRLGQPNRIFRLPISHRSSSLSSWLALIGPCLAPWLGLAALLASFGRLELVRVVCLPASLWAVSLWLALTMRQSLEKGRSLSAGTFVGVWLWCGAATLDSIGGWTRLGPSGWAALTCAFGGAIGLAPWHRLAVRASPPMVVRQWVRRLLSWRSPDLRPAPTTWLQVASGALRDAWFGVRWSVVWIATLAVAGVLSEGAWSWLQAVIRLVACYGLYICSQVYLEGVLGMPMGPQLLCLPVSIHRTARLMLLHMGLRFLAMLGVLALGAIALSELGSGSSEFLWFLSVLICLDAPFRARVFLQLSQLGGRLMYLLAWACTLPMAALAYWLVRGAPSALAPFLPEPSTLFALAAGLGVLLLGANLHFWQPVLRLAFPRSRADRQRARQDGWAPVHPGRETRESAALTAATLRLLER